MVLKKGMLLSFDQADYTARVALSSEGKTCLEGVAVARNIASETMVVGRNVAVFFPAERNATEAVIVAVYML